MIFFKPTARNCRRLTVACLLPALLQILSACGNSSSTPPPDSPAMSPGSLQFSASAFSTNENVSNAEVNVTRDGGTDGAVSITVEITSGGTAQDGQDYTAVSQVLNFADGEGGSKTASVTILDDAIHEADETIALLLTAATGGASLGARSSAMLTVIDDDPLAHTIGGLVMELAGTGLVLQNNAADDLTITASGAFVFLTPLPENTSYSVTVKTQPIDSAGNPAANCTATSGAGTVGTADVTSVLVFCLPPVGGNAGTLDSTFGNGGKVTTDFSGAP
jgi:hypothetical protein